MKSKFIMLFISLLLYNYGVSDIILVYESGTSPKTKGTAIINCSPIGCSTACDEGWGGCTPSSTISVDCPTYGAVAAACPGAGRIWVSPQVDVEVQNIWDMIESNILLGTFSKSYHNPTTGETVLINFSWTEIVSGSGKFEIRISTNSE